jgi:hypothetical protein
VLFGLRIPNAILQPHFPLLDQNFAIFVSPDCVVVYVCGSRGQEPVGTDEGVFFCPCPGWGFLHVPGNCMSQTPTPSTMSPPGPCSPLQKPRSPPTHLAAPCPTPYPTPCPPPTPAKSPHQDYPTGLPGGGHPPRWPPRRRTTRQPLGGLWKRSRS